LGKGWEGRNSREKVVGSEAEIDLDQCFVEDFEN
jgi:hypothetical protein